MRNSSAFSPCDSSRASSFYNIFRITTPTQNFRPLCFLETHQTERDAWRKQAQEYIVGLGKAIAVQLKEWGLTAAESETALFLLKGFSRKEIGKFTGKSERAVRLLASLFIENRGLQVVQNCLHSSFKVRG